MRTKTAPTTVYKTSMVATDQTSIEGYDEILEILTNSDNTICDLKLVESNVLNRLAGDLFLSPIKRAIILKKMGYTRQSTIRYNKKDYYFWSKYNKTPDELRVYLEKELTNDKNVL